MNAAGKGNAEIARTSIDYVKARGVETGGDMETVMLGEEAAPLATYWGDLAELAEKTEDIMVIGSDPRNSKMFGWELPLNVDIKPALRAVWKMNKKAKETDVNATALRVTLVTKPDQFYVGRGPGPLEGMYMFIIESDDASAVADMIDAVADTKMAMRIDRALDAATAGERVCISLQMAGMAGRIYARELTLKASMEVFVYSDAWDANEYKQGGKAWTALRQYFGADVELLVGCVELGVLLLHGVEASCELVEAVVLLLCRSGVLASRHVLLSVGGGGRLDPRGPRNLRLVPSRGAVLSGLVDVLVVLLGERGELFDQVARILVDPAAGGGEWRPRLAVWSNWRTLRARRFAEAELAGHRVVTCWRGSLGHARRERALGAGCCCGLVHLAGSAQFGCVLGAAAAE